MRSVGLKIAPTYLVKRIADENGRSSPTDEDRDKAHQQSLAIRFIRGAGSQHQDYLTELCNAFLDGNNNYPMTLHDAYNILLCCEPTRPAQVAFVTPGFLPTTPGTDGRHHSHITCNNCGKQGHYANQCPKQNDANQQQDQRGIINRFALSQPLGRIPISWILLDNQSTLDVFCNRQLL